MENLVEAFRVPGWWFLMTLGEPWHFLLIFTTILDGLPYKTFTLTLSFLIAVPTLDIYSLTHFVSSVTCGLSMVRLFCCICGSGCYKLIWLQHTNSCGIHLLPSQLSICVAMGTLAAYKVQGSFYIILQHTIDCKMQSCKCCYPQNKLYKLMSMV